MLDPATIPLSLVRVFVTPLAESGFGGGFAIVGIARHDRGHLPWAPLALYLQRLGLPTAPLPGGRDWFPSSAIS